MPFESIDLTNGGNIRYTMRRLARCEMPFLSILHLSFSGDYRAGCDGAVDARYIRGIVETACTIWRPSGLILDLAGLSYEAGEGIDELFEPVIDEPVAYLVSSLCEPGMSRKCRHPLSSKTILDRENVFNSFDLALRYAREKVVENWNSRASASLLWSHTPVIDTSALA
ncbi:MAG TPA: hypothetical protein VHY22_07710 [Chthoniobacteraceae bacterium]|jgi:hypothetical protein|nr:hypothetical protein [Chthoniobacteraceae bacterium]